MPNSQLWPRAPRFRRIAGLALIAVALATSAKIAPTTASAEPPPVDSAPVTTSTTTPAEPSPPPPPTAAPVDHAAMADPVMTGLIRQPARTASTAAAPTETARGETPTPAAPSGDPLDRAYAILAAVIPGSWLAAVPAQLSIVGGSTSMSYTDGTIEIARSHLDRSDAWARSTIAHEWGHQLAFRYGTRAFLGAGPAGFPYDGRRPEEAWADCVAEALTGVTIPSHGLAPCPGDALAFTAAFLAAGP